MSRLIKISIYDIVGQHLLAYLLSDVQDLKRHKPQQSKRRFPQSLQEG